MESSHVTGRAQSLTRTKRTRGFTLIEMVVVLGIITIVLAVILVSQASFNRTLLLTDTAYTMALSLRESQAVGLSSRLYSGLQNVGLGIHLTGGVPLSSYNQFADIDPVEGNNGSQLTWPLNVVCPNHTITDATDPEAHAGDCQDTAADTTTQTYNFGQGYTISSYCVYLALNGKTYCSPYLDDLVIEFERPNTQTVIVGSFGVNQTISPHDFDEACIAVSAPPSAGTGTRYVDINKYGEVSVDTVSACP